MQQLQGLMSSEANKYRGMTVLGISVGLQLFLNPLSTFSSSYKKVDLKGDVKMVFEGK